MRAASRAKSCLVKSAQEYQESVPAILSGLSACTTEGMTSKGGATLVRGLVMGP